MKLRSQNIIVTGGGSGIGKAVAKRLAEENIKVIICGRNQEKLEKSKEDINLNNVFTMTWDISDISAFNIKTNQAEELIGGKIGGFVNAAAIGSSQCTKRGYEPWDITEEEWDCMSDINFKAAFFTMRNEIDYMLKNHICGNILNIASNAACMDITGSYGAAKLSIVKWTRAFAKRYGHNGIIINGIAPGATYTPMISDYAHDISQKYERHAIGRFIRAEEIAELAYYLMSDYGEIICGHTVVADGGDNAATL